MTQDLGEIDSRTRLERSERNRRTISAKLTHDLDLANRRNRFLTNESPAHVQLIPLIIPDPNWVCRPLRQRSPNSNINCKISNCSSVIQTECTIHAFPSHFTEEKHHMSRDQRMCLQLSNWMTSRRTHHEPTLTLQLTGSLQSKCLQDGPTKSE